MVEILIALAIIGVVGGVIIGFLQYGMKSYQNSNEEVDIQYDAQVLLNQVGDYIVNVDHGLKQQDNKLYIYQNTEDALEADILSWNSDKKILYYEKIKKVNNVESTLVEKTVLSKNVACFSVDLSKAEKESKVDAVIVLQKGKKSYEAKATWNLRNEVTVSVDE